MKDELAIFNKPKSKISENISANVVGIIANKVNPRKKDKYYHYYSE